MKTVKVDFTGANPTIDFSESLDGFESTVQKGLINTVTRSGSDKTFPDRGTNLFTNAVRGNLINSEDAAHESNFAALDTFFFVNENVHSGETEYIKEYRLEPLEFGNGTVKLNAIFTSTLNRVIGNSAEL